MNPKDLSERLMQFAVRVAKVVDSLPESKLGQHIAGQLIRSGTSPAANYEESCAAESKKDFAHKLSICLKGYKRDKSLVKTNNRNRSASKRTASRVDG